MDNPEDITAAMKRWKVTPYVYVHHSFKQLVDGNYDGAFKLLALAARFEGVYYKKGTVENENYGNTIMTLQYIMLHLVDEFKQCNPDIKKTAPARFKK
jgi:hypothetical protein